MPEPLVHPLDHVVGERVAELVGVHVGLGGRVAHEVGQEALDQAMLADDALGPLDADRRQDRLLVLAPLDEPVGLEPLQHLPGRGARDAEHLGDARGDRIRRRRGPVLADREREKVDRLEVLVDRMSLPVRHDRASRLTFPTAVTIVRPSCKACLTDAGRAGMSQGQILVLGAIAGLTIFLGLPAGRLQRLSTRAGALLSATATGILLFLLWDVLSAGIEPVEAALNAAALDHDGTWGASPGCRDLRRRLRRRPDEPRLLRPDRREAPPPQGLPRASARPRSPSTSAPGSLLAAPVPRR